MTSYRVSQTVDSKREEFRKYLENTGLLDVLTRVLVELYENDDKPEDVIQDQLGIVNPDVKETEALKDEIHNLKKKIETLEKENEYLKGQLSDRKK